MPNSTLRVAVIGGGPGGLATAISLSKLPFIKVKIYEAARELREIGAGIQIGYNCWRVLELLGAAQDVKGHIHGTIFHRNGLNGDVAWETPAAAGVENKYRAQRVRRTRLQAALIKQVPEGIIQLKKRLVSLENLTEGGVSLTFEDGEEVIADLVVGGDGIRSAVRENIFPDHAIKFTGRTIWRVILPRTLINHIPEMTSNTTWWHGPAGHFYNCLVDDEEETPADEQMWEIAVHNVVSPDAKVAKRFYWGIPATNERVESHFEDYDPRVREALSKVPEGLWKEFSSFSGPRLENVIAWDKVVLIGDASHPLTGAFGSGAAFAMQDGWILARALEYSQSSPQPLAAALKIFDEIRSPYYARMYKHLDQQVQKIQDAKARNPEQSFAESLDARAKVFGGAGNTLSWIYENDIELVWKEYLQAQ